MFPGDIGLYAGLMADPSACPARSTGPWRWINHLQNIPGRPRLIPPRGSAQRAVIRLYLSARFIMHASLSSGPGSRVGGQAVSGDGDGEARGRPGGGGVVTPSAVIASLARAACAVTLTTWPAQMPAVELQNMKVNGALIRRPNNGLSRTCS